MCIRDSDYSRTPGGSSSGSAAVVASHMAHLSIGSQTGGSIIRPASYCGVVGYKPSYGLISRNGVLKTSDKLDTMGVFGKTVKDVALLAKALIKKDLYDPATVHFAADDMIKVCEEGPVFEPKFIFYKTDNWKKIDKESQVPDYLQLINQIKEGVSSREQEINRLIRDVDNASAILDLERSIVLKAFRQLEFQGILLSLIHI